MFDATKGWSVGSGATSYETLLAHNLFKFFDGEMHYSDAALHVLIRSLQRAGMRDRELFFLSTLGCRRRLEQQWLDTPLAKALFTTRVHAIRTCTRTNAHTGICRAR